MKSQITSSKQANMNQTEHANSFLGNNRPHLYVVKSANEGEPLSSVSNKGQTFSVGDYVEFLKDGARGVVYSVNEDKYQILWEDYFVSWEDGNLLRRMK